MFTFSVCFCIIPWQFWERKRSRESQPLVRRAGSPFPRRKTSSNVILCSPKFLWSSGSKCHCERCGGGALFLLHTCSPAYTMPFNLLTSICTYKQCLQRNTFTGVDWLVHNNPYLGWYGKLTVISHTNDVSDPSYYNIHWPDSVVQWFNNPFKKCCTFHQES